MSSLSLFRGHLSWIAEMVLSGEEGVGTGEQLPPSKSVKKVPISRKTLEHFSTLDLTQTLDKTFHQCAHSTATCRVLLG